ncbi:hypothetical protein [Streptomyces globisporus]
MVQSSAQDVAQNLAEAPEARREALTRLRALCREELTQKIDFELVRDLLRATAAAPGTPC